jgi:hypothetical protein
MTTINQDMMSDLANYDHLAILSQPTIINKSVGRIVTNINMSVRARLATINELKTIRNELVNKKVINRDIATQLNDETDGGLFSRISLEEYTINNTRTNLEFSLRYINDVVDDTIVSIVTDLSNIISTAKLELESILDTIDLDIEKALSTFNLKEALAPQMAILNEFLIVYVGDVEVNCLSEDLLATELEILSPLANYFKCNSKGYNYPGLYMLVKNNKHNDVDGKVTIVDLVNYFNVNNAYMVRNLAEDIKSCLLAMDEFKHGMDGITDKEVLTTYITTNSGKLLNTIYSVYDGKYLITDVIDISDILVDVVNRLASMK